MSENHLLSLIRNPYLVLRITRNSMQQLVGKFDLKLLCLTLFSFLNTTMVCRHCSFGFVSLLQPSTRPAYVIQCRRALQYGLKCISRSVHSCSFLLCTWKFSRKIPVFMGPTQTLRAHWVFGEVLWSPPATNRSRIRE